MRDERYTKLAEVLVNYSAAVERKQLVLISGPTVAEPLMTEVYRAVLKAGAHPTARPFFPGLAKVFYDGARKHQLEFVSPLAKFETETVDRFITIWGDENTKSLSNVDPEKQKEYASILAYIVGEYLPILPLIEKHLSVYASSTRVDWAPKDHYIWFNAPGRCAEMMFFQFWVGLAKFKG